MDIRKKITSKHNPEQWYQAWISEETVIPPVFKIESDQRVGGQFVLYAKMGAQTSKMIGKFLNLIYGKEIQYRWEWEGSHELTQVTVKFLKEPDGTEIILEHTGFTNLESHHLHDQGWDRYVKGVELFINSR